MQAIRDFLYMGGYAGFVWPAFLATAALMAGLAGLSRRRQREVARRLEELRRLADGGEEDETS